MPHWHAKHSGPGFACPFCAATERFGFWSFLSVCHASEMIQLRDVLSAADEPEESPEPSEQSVGSARISDAPRDDEATLEILDWRKRDREREKKNLKKHGHQKLSTVSRARTHNHNNLALSFYALYINIYMILPPSACALNWIWNDLEISPSHTSADPHGISIVSMGFLCHHVYTSSYEVVVSSVTGI